MIRGIGTEIVEVTRVAAMIERHGERFLLQTYGTAELRYCRESKRTNELYAAIYACKVATLKALGVIGPKKRMLREISIMPRNGRVRIRLKGSVQELTQGDHGPLWASFTFTRQYATATVIVAEDETTKGDGGSLF
jgi:holo-[acyl-carrier protein] synthase